MRPEEQSDNLDLPDEARAAIGLIPCGLFVMTAAFDDRTAGVLVRLVQLCAPEPPLISVSMLRGQALEPLIRDSRAFALCQIADGDRFLQRKFAPNEGIPGGQRNTCPEAPTEEESPFVSVPVHSAPNGSPIIERAMSWLECELVRNVELDPDHRIYVGRITAGGILDASVKPAVLFGYNGAK